MSVDMTLVKECKRELERYADELADIHTGISRCENRLNAAWVASESATVKDAINRLNRKIDHARDELNNIGTDMLRAAGDIAEEEAAAEMEARKEGERAEAEKASADKKTAEDKKATTEKSAGKKNSVDKKTAEKKGKTSQKASAKKIDETVKKVFSFLK